MNELKTLYSGKFLNLVERNGWEYVTRNTHDVAIILPIFDNGDILLISEYRHPLQQKVISMPAGLIGDHEDENIISGALRELQEETGYTAETLECILENSPSSSGLTSELFQMYIARGLVKVGPGGGDASEDIDVIRISSKDFLKNIPKWKKEGLYIDPKIFIGLYFIQHK